MCGVVIDVAVVVVVIVVVVVVVVVGVWYRSLLLPVDKFSQRFDVSPDISHFQVAGSLEIFYM
jgi:hypothetical protein